MLAKHQCVFCSSRICASLLSARILEILLWFRCASLFVPHRSTPSTPNTNKPISVWKRYAGFQDPYHWDTSLGTIVMIRSEKVDFETWFSYTDDLIVLPAFTSTNSAVVCVLAEPIQFFQRKHVSLIIIPYLPTYLFSLFSSYQISWIKWMYTSFKLTTKYCDNRRICRPAFICLRICESDDTTPIRIIVFIGTEIL